MSTPLTRADLQRVFGNDHKILLAFEQMQQAVATNTVSTATNVAATADLQDATVLTLSSNDALNNERILAVGDGLGLTDLGPGQQLILSLLNLIVLSGGFGLTFNVTSDTSLSLPASGRVMVNTDFSSLSNFANDAAAASGGVPVGGLYRTGSSVSVRVS